MPTIMRKISVISRCASQYCTNNSSKNLPGIYHSYIIAICKHPGSSQDFLTKYLCKNKSSVTRHLTFLENESFIERKTCPTDKRELLVYPTEKMLSLLPETYEIARKWNSLLTADVDKNELDIFSKVLDKMYNTAKNVIYGKEEDK